MKTTNKVLVAVMIALATVNIIDFVFYGQELRNLTGAAGFFLMAFGSLKNRDWGLVLGGLLAIGAILLKYAS